MTLEHINTLSHTSQEKDAKDYTMLELEQQKLLIEDEGKPLKYVMLAIMIMIPAAIIGVIFLIGIGKAG